MHTLVNIIHRPIRRVFLVEDNPTTCANLIFSLSELAKVEVVGAAAGEQEALEWLDRNAQNANFIVLDLLLAQGSGIGVLQALGRRNSVPPIVVLTNYATVDIREKCLALGAVELFDKISEIDDFFIFVNA